jgi:Uma2 family endonuclease
MLAHDLATETRGAGVSCAMSAATPHPMTAAEYLEWERLQPYKHEYRRGEIFAMSGGSPRHNFLGAAATRELSMATRGRGCGVFSSDQKIALIAGERYVYADGVVVCGELQRENGTTDILLNPRIVVEVLSRSTEAYDRGEKWEGYQGIASLTDYVLVAQRTARVEHYQREALERRRGRDRGALSGRVRLPRRLTRQLQAKPPSRRTIQCAPSINAAPIAQAQAGSSGATCRSAAT